MNRLPAFIAGTLVVAVSVFSAPQAVADETLDRIYDNNELVVSTAANWPPQSFMNANHEMDGFDIDVARELAKRLGVEVRFVTPEWDIITAGNWNGRWDISVGSMTPTKARTRILDFPAIYYYTPYVFAVHKDSSIDSRADVNGKVIGVEGGTTSEDYIRRRLVIDAIDVPEFTYDVEPGEIKTFAESMGPLDNLRLGDGVRLDAVIAAMSTVQAAMKNGYPIRPINDSSLYYEPLALATDKGDEEFDQKVADIIAEMKEDGTLSAFSDKWYGVDYIKVEK